MQCDETVYCHVASTVGLFKPVLLARRVTVFCLGQCFVYADAVRLSTFCGVEMRKGHCIVLLELLKRVVQLIVNATILTFFMQDRCSFSFGEIRSDGV